MQVQAQKLKNFTPTKLITIGIGSGVDVNDLNSMASPPISDNVMMVPNFYSLSNYEYSLIDAMCPVTPRELSQNANRVDYCN